MVLYDIVENGDGWRIEEKSELYGSDLRDRLLKFSIDILKFLGKLPYKKEFDVIRYQLSKSATSIGANYEEAQSSSPKEFTQKTRIALREANETKYWLNILNELNLGDANIRNYLLSEIHEISLILGAIVSKMAKKLNE